MDSPIRKKIKIVNKNKFRFTKGPASLAAEN